MPPSCPTPRPIVEWIAEPIGRAHRVGTIVDVPSVQGRDQGRVRLFAADDARRRVFRSVLTEQKSTAGDVSSEGRVGFRAIVAEG
jgi:hypothetical protein